MHYQLDDTIPVEQQAKLDDAIRRARRQAALRELLPLAKMLRRRAGLSQAAMAKLVGVRPSCVTRWERGNRRPRGVLLEQYATVLQHLTHSIGVDDDER